VGVDRRSSAADCENLVETMRPLYASCLALLTGWAVTSAHHGAVEIKKTLYNSDDIQGRKTDSPTRELAFAEASVPNGQPIITYWS